MTTQQEENTGLCGGLNPRHIYFVNIILYKKSGCPWAAAVSGFLNELNVPFETRNVTTHRHYAEEIQKKSGKCISPTLEIDGEIVADASVEQVAEVLEKKGIVL